MGPGRVAGGFSPSPHTTHHAGPQWAVHEENYTLPPTYGPSRKARGWPHGATPSVTHPLGLNVGIESATARFLFMTPLYFGEYGYGGAPYKVRSPCFSWRSILQAGLGAGRRGRALAVATLLTRCLPGAKAKVPKRANFSILWGDVRDSNP